MSEQPQYYAQLFLKDLQSLPMGISLDIMTYTGKLFKSVLFLGIIKDNNVWYFNSPKMPSGQEMYAYGCVPNVDGQWTTDYYIILSDVELRKSYEKSRFAKSCLGKKISDVSTSEILRRMECETIRTINPDVAFTTDWDEFRANLHLDNDGFITKLEVG